MFAPRSRVVKNVRNSVVLNIDEALKANQNGKIKMEKSKYNNSWSAGMIPEIIEHRIEENNNGKPKLNKNCSQMFVLRTKL